MTSMQFPDTTTLQVYQQFVYEVTQAQTFTEATGYTLAALDAALTPCVSQVVWQGGSQPRVISTRAGEVTHEAVLDPALRVELEGGEVVVQARANGVTEAYAPVRARGALLGWVYVETTDWSSDAQFTFAAIAAHLGPVLALLDASAVHEQRVAQLNVLTDIGRSFTSVLNLDVLLDDIYQSVRRLVDAPSFYIGLYEPVTKMLELSYTVVNYERHMTEARWKIHEGLTQVVIETKAPFYTNDYLEECRRRNIKPRQLGDLPFGKAWLAVPLFVHDRFIGIMNVNSVRQGYVYRQEQVDLLATIGAQAAIAIENARLYQHSQRQARELETLNRIGRTITSLLDPARVPSLIIDQACELLGSEEGSLLLVDDASGDLVFAYTSGTVGQQLLGQRLPRGTGIAGYVMTHGVSQIVNNVRYDARFYDRADRSTGFTTRSVIAVPLRSASGVLGVIEMLNPGGGAPFTPDDQRMLEALADQAVIALENARTFADVDQALARRAQELAVTNEMLEHNLQSLTALNAVALAMNTTLRSPSEILGMTARGVVEMTGALGASVLLLEGERLRCVTHAGEPHAVAELELLAAGAVHLGAPKAFPHALRSGHTLYTVPLRSMQRTLGVLCVYYANDLPDVSDQEMTILFATQAASALENIELFNEVRSARDEMASILASTRDGIMLLDADGQITLSNRAFQFLCNVEPPDAQQISVKHFLTRWKQCSGYAPTEWNALRRGLETVLHGEQAFVCGELSAVQSGERSFEWSALAVTRRELHRGGALLVLRDISEAKEAERLRNDLTNMIVHDLRSPLSSIMAAIDLLVRGVPGNVSASQQNVLTIAYNSAVQMLDMISTLLDISRLEDRRLPLHRVACEVEPLVQQARERLISLARDRAILVQGDLPAELPTVYVDKELIVRVLQNLLGNAIKFSGRGSTVLIRAEVITPAPAAMTEQDTPPQPLLCVAVSDRGVGIAPRDQEKIFAKFLQVGEQRGGSGLGLTFCKLVVEEHGGTIWVESALGEGSTFFFTLPLAAG